MNPGLICKFSPWSYGATWRKEKIGDVWKAGIAAGNSHQVSTAKTLKGSLGKRKSIAEMPGVHAGHSQGSIPPGTELRGTRGEAGCPPGAQGARPLLPGMLLLLWS